MNCEWVEQNASFYCKQVTTMTGDAAVEIGTPFSHPDGTAIVLYAVETGNQVLISDNGDTMANLSSTGINISQGRIKALRNLVQPFGLTLSTAGDFRCLAHSGSGRQALANVINALLVIGEWHKDKCGIDDKTDDLITEAEMYLRAWRPREEVIRHATATGMSGRAHTFDLQMGNELIEIVPANSMSTGATMRKAADVRNQPANASLRIRVIVDDRRNKERADDECRIMAALADAMTLSQLKRLSASAGDLPH